MKAIEFYTTPEGEVTMRPIGEAERQLKETDTDFIQAFLLYPSFLGYTEGVLSRSIRCAYGYIL